jgi:hypothetical protein
MKFIWKYGVPDNGVINMPVGAEILQVREQFENVCLWALVEPGAPLEQRRFIMFGTGHPIPTGALVYRGSAHLKGGALVLHVFELQKELLA